MGVMFKDGLFEAQWLRTVGHASSGGAEVGECLAAAGRIKEPDPESWRAAWLELAERLAAEGEACLAAGRRVSARAAFLRASNYFRSAYVFLIGGSSEAGLAQAYRRSKETFRAAAALADGLALPIEIPYQDTSLPGYLFAPKDGRRKARPAVVLVGGYDSTAEEAYVLSAAAALERGSACIAFDGPGQGGALIERGLKFRPDWEEAVGPAIAFAEARAEIDASKIALLGISFGGCLAPRAASREHRIAALIVDPGQLSLFEEVKSRLPAPIARGLENDDPIILKLLQFLLERRVKTPTSGWGLRRGMWTHGAGSALDYLRLTKAYGVGEEAGAVRCPTLVCQAEGDEVGATAKRLYDALRCEKTFIAFRKAEGAGEHCEAGARSLFNARAFDWLDEVFARSESRFTDAASDVKRPPSALAQAAAAEAG